MSSTLPVSLSSCFEITRKDLRLLLRDRRAIVVLIVLPVAFIAILGLSTGRLLGWRSSNQTLRLAVINRDSGAVSDRVIRRLTRIAGVDVRPVTDNGRLTALLNDEEVNAGIIIGSDFSHRLLNVRPEELGNDQNTASRDLLSRLDVTIVSRPEGVMVASVVEQLTLFSILQAALPQIAGLPVADEPADRLPEESKALSENSREEASGNPVYQTIVPGYTVMFAFFLVNIMARSFIAERELGTLSRLRIAPVSTADVILGKTLPFLLISLMQCGSLFLIGRLLFGMSWGQDPWILIPVLLCTSLAATGLGLLVSTCVQTDSQVSAYANFLVITLAGISGCFMPRDWLPETMRQISLAVPHAWALIAFHEALADRPPELAVIGRSCLALTGFAITFLLAGCWRFRRIA